MQSSTEVTSAVSMTFSFDLFMMCALLNVHSN